MPVKTGLWEESVVPGKVHLFFSVLIFSQTSNFLLIGERERQIHEEDNSCCIGCRGRSLFCLPLSLEGARVQCYLMEWEKLGEMKAFPIANGACKAHCSVAHKFFSGTLSNNEFGAKDALKLSSKPHDLSVF